MTRRYVLDARAVTNHFPGIGRYVYSLASEMPPYLAADERLILLRDSTAASHWEITDLAGPQVDIIDVPLSPFSLAQQWKIPRLLKKLNADLYHSPYYIMPYRPAVPTVLTMYDIIPLLYPQYSSLKARLLFRLTTSLALRTAAHVLAISEATRRDTLNTYPLAPEKITAIPLAADAVFKPQPPEVIAALRARLDLPEAYLLYVGSNKPHKNLPRLVAAWAGLPSSETGETTLLIAGAWEARYTEAQQVAEQHSSTRVRFLGPVAEADLPALYAGALAFVFPSEYEGFGLPVLEAMACGVPVACSNVSSLPEIAGETALFFDPTDTGSIRAALHRLLTEAALRSNLAARGQHQAAQFSWSHTARITRNVYRNLSSRYF